MSIYEKIVAAGVKLFLLGEDYTKLGFAPIIKPQPLGVWDGPIENAENFFEEESKMTKNLTRTLKDISDKEKINYYDKIYTFALRAIEDMENSGYEDENVQDEAFRLVMNILPLSEKDRDKFWQYYESLDDLWR